MALIDGLVEYFPLSEVSGNRAGLHIPLTLTDNGSTGSATGLVYAKAAQFVEGGGDFLTAADEANMSAGDIDFTIAFSVYFDALPAWGRDLISKDGDGTNEYNAYMDSTSLKWRVVNSSGSYSERTWSSALSTATWYTIFVDHDSVGNTHGISVNAATRQSEPWTTGVRDGANQFKIGGNNMGGRIGPVLRWNKMLTADERTEYYNSGTPLTYAAMAASAVKVPIFANHYRQRRS